MFLETASPSPAAYFATAPEDYRPDTVFPAITADNLRRTLFAEMRPAAVLCGAAWAAPYRAQHADLAALARETGDRFAFFTLDVLREEELAAWVKVRVLPTTLLFSGDRIVKRKVRVLPTTLLFSGDRIVKRFAGQAPRREIQSALAAAAFPVRR